MDAASKLEKNQRTLRWLAVVFLGLTTAGMGIVLSHAGGLTPTLRALERLFHSPRLLFLLLFVLLLDWFTEYLRYRVLARRLGVEIPFGFGMKIVFANLFFSYLAPGGTFGAPFVVYMLYKRGVHVSKAVAIALIKPFLLFFLLLVLGVFVIVFHSDVATSPTMRNLSLISSGLVGLLTMFMAMVIFRPAAARNLATRFFASLRRRRSRKSPDRPTDRLDHWEKSVGSTIDAFALFGAAGWRGMLEGLLTTLLNLATFLALSVVLLHIADIQVPETTKWVYSFFYYFFIAFAPTPGASGLAEGGGYLFFQTIAPASQVSTYILLWRFFTCYLVMLIGAILSFAFLQEAERTESRPTRDAVLAEKPPPPNGTPPAHASE